VKISRKNNLCMAFGSSAAKFRTERQRPPNNIEFLQVIRAVTAREGEAEFDSPETVKKQLH
jgi:hypothetical protein